MLGALFVGPSAGYAASEITWTPSAVEAKLRPGEVKTLKAVSTATMDLPPDPGKAGKATLEGIDSDGDGVRDDIQRYIALTYPDSARTRAALTQLAKVNQQAILNADNKPLSLDNGSAQDRAIECLWYLLDDGAIAVSHGLRAVILNTVERNRVYIRYNDQLAGEVFPSVPLSQDKFSCEFDPDGFPN